MLTYFVQSMVAVKEKRCGKLTQVPGMLTFAG